MLPIPLSLIRNYLCDYGVFTVTLNKVSDLASGCSGGYLHPKVCQRRRSSRYAFGQHAKEVGARGEMACLRHCRCHRCRGEKRRRKSIERSSLQVLAFHNRKSRIFDRDDIKEADRRVKRNTRRPRVVQRGRGSSWLRCGAREGTL